jgi:hypothetical protein
MERKVKQAFRKVRDNDFSGALTILFAVYNNFYQKKNVVKRQHLGKNFKAIANSDCPHYQDWRKEFTLIDPQSITILKAIEMHSHKNAKRYINGNGEDILKQTRAMREHCGLFASMRKKSIQQEEQENNDEN